MSSILVVEDDPIVAMALAALLEQEGFIVATVASGEAAVRSVKASGSGSNLILMDIDLGPGIDGVQAAKEILEHSEIPILFLSAHTEPEIVAKAESVTSYGYVVKNSGDVVLLASIRMAFRMHAARQSILRQKMEIESANEELESALEELETANQQLIESERIILASERRYRQLFENMTAGFALHEMIYDNNGRPVDYRFLDVNPAFERLTGLKAVDLIGCTVLQKMPETEPYWIETYGAVAISGNPISYENFSRELNRYYDVWAFSPVRNQFAVIFSDVTDRRVAERRIAENEQRFRAMIANSSDVTALLDQEGIIRYISPNISRSFGWDESDIEGRAFRDLIHPSHDDDCFAGTFSGPGETLRRDCRFRCKDGTVKWIQVTLADLVGNPSVGGLLLNFFDITEHKLLTRTREFLAEGGWNRDGENFFQALALFLSEVLEAEYICIDRLQEDSLEAETVAVFHDGGFEDNVRYRLEDTPCGAAVGKRICAFKERVCELFPQDEVLRKIHAESYIGVTLRDSRGMINGLIAVISRKPLLNIDIAESVLDTVSYRAAGELERTSAEAALRESETRFRGYIENAPEGVFVADDRGNYIMVNRAACDTTGYSEKELCSMNLVDMIHPDDRERAAEHFERVVVDGLAEGDMRFITAQGEHRCWMVKAVRLSDNRFLGFTSDITEKKRIEEEKDSALRALQESVAQKEMLMKELQHRVKNNLNVISSLLALEVKKLTEPHAVQVIEEARNRVVSMSGIYDHLQLSGDLVNVDMGLYFQKLACAIAGTYTLHKGLVRLETDLDSVVLNSRFAVPLGLILNELMSNAFKYAFPGDSPGEIRIALKKNSEYIVLTVSDNGVGFPSVPKDDASGGMGLKLVRMLASQINASVSMGGEPGGVSVAITLKQ